MGLGPMTLPEIPLERRRDRQPALPEDQQRQEVAAPASVMTSGERQGVVTEYAHLRTTQ